MENSATTDSELIAELNDLLQLDHDAVQAYGIAIALLRNERYKQTLAGFRADHERHIDELTTLISAKGGTPVQLPHLPSGVFKLAMQAIGAAGGDRAVLLAFKANERQVRDKYRRIAREVHTADVTSTLARNADDENRHYLWVLDTLEDDFGIGADSPIGRAERVVERAHARMADGMEAVERRAMQVAGDAGGALYEQVKRNPVGSALAALGAGFLMAAVLRGRR